MIPALLALVVLVAWILFLSVRHGKKAQVGVREGENQAVLAEFVVRSLELHGLAEVLADAAATGQAAFGASRAVVFEPGAKDGAWDVWLPGPQPLDPVPDAARGVFGWLKHNATSIALDDLSGPRYGAMRLPLGELKTRYGIDLLVPLVDRRQVIAALGLALGRRPSAHELELIDHLRIEATAAAANVRLHREAAHKLTLEKEVDLASAVQRTLVPAVSEGSTAPLSWVGHFRPAGQAGSDFWTAYELGPGRLLVVVGDVIGSGVAGSMVSAAAKSCCDALAAHGKIVAPGTLLSLLNRALYRPVKPSQMTCFAALFDAKRHTLSWANAGHALPYLAAAGEDKLSVLTGAGPMLGDSAEATFDSHERTLAAGDTVLLFTDGLVEAMNRERISFGERRLQKAFARCSAQKPAAARDHILAALDGFRAGVEPVDDEVLVIVRRA
jgi:serine phosphatase RsbU (regulator of sigma subunit)